MKQKNQMRIHTTVISPFLVCICLRNDVLCVTEMAGVGLNSYLLLPQPYRHMQAVSSDYLDINRIYDGVEAEIKKSQARF